MSRPIIIGARCECGWFLGGVKATVTSDHIGPFVSAVSGTCKRHGDGRPAAHDYHVWWTDEVFPDHSYPAASGGRLP